jgi:hypothetical protein
MEFNINKINSNAINAYKSIKHTKAADSAISEKSSGAKAGSYDSVEIDFSRLMESAKAGLVSKLTVGVDAAQIRELREKYGGEDCPVSANEIANAILSME